MNDNKYKNQTIDSNINNNLVIVILFMRRNKYIKIIIQRLFIIIRVGKIPNISIKNLIPKLPSIAVPKISVPQAVEKKS